MLKKSQLNGRGCVIALKPVMNCIRTFGCAARDDAVKNCAITIGFYIYAVIMCKFICFYMLRLEYI